MTKEENKVNNPEWNPVDDYQPLFDFFYKEHNKVLLKTEMDDIISTVLDVVGDTSKKEIKELRKGIMQWKADAEKLAMQLKHIYDQYSDEWTNHNVEETQNIIIDWEIKQAHT